MRRVDGFAGIRGKLLAGAVVLALAVVGAGAGAAAAPGGGSGAPPAGAAGVPPRVAPVLDRARHGQDALAHLEAAGKVGAVAARVGWSPERLRGALASDPSLVVQPDGALAYADVAAAEGAGAPVGAAAAAGAYSAAELAQTFTLASDPGAAKVLYLDFVGFTDVVYNSSTGLYDIPFTYTAFDLDGNRPCAVGTADPACFTTDELTMVRDTWARVAAAYAPFAVNVTTQYPGRDAIAKQWCAGLGGVCSPADTQYGAHITFSDETQDYCQLPGVVGCGTIGGLDDVRGGIYATWQEVQVNVITSEIAVYAPVSAYNLAEIAVHEIGHVLGLLHAPQNPYSAGQTAIGGGNGCAGPGNELWAAWMYACMRTDSTGAPLHQFVPFGMDLGSGRYYGADVYAVMEYLRDRPEAVVPAPTRGIVARPDEPSPVVEPAADFVVSGMIGPSRSTWQDPALARPTDQDSYRFTVPAGAVGTTIDVTPAKYSSLDVKATLYDAAMTPVASSDPPAVRVDADTAIGLDASISAVLAPGEYTLVVDGVGSPGVDNSVAGLNNVTPSCSECTAADYGSIGAYTVNVATQYAEGVSVGSGSVAEGDAGKPRAISFPVVLPAPSAVPVTVDYAIEADGTTNAATACATAAACAPGSGGDVRSRTGTLKFNPSATTGLTPTVKYVTALVYPDTAAEGDETFRVVLSNPVGVGLGRSLGVGTILDDDPVGASPVVSIGDTTIPEGDTGVKVTTTNNGKLWVTLSEPATGPVTVKVTVAPVDATPATDFKFASITSVFPVTKTITFAAGQWKKAVTIGVFPDAATEGDETVTATLSAPTGGPVLGRSTATFTILDDD